MTSRRPYLIRAMHEWMTDNLQTPHLMVNVSIAGVVVPPQYVQEEKIILNVSYSACQNLTMSNERIEFNARFGGQPHHVIVPIQAVLGIYARETGQGMIFAEEDELPPEPTTSGDTAERESSSSDTAAKPASRGRAQLKIVK